MYKLCFYVAEEFLTPIKEAIFSVGAGSYDGFKNCCWQTKGEGQYQPDGELLSEQIEYKVEVYCADHCMEDVLAALKSTHPCDEPAYDCVLITR